MIETRATMINLSHSSPNTYLFLYAYVKGCIGLYEDLAARYAGSKNVGATIIFLNNL